MAMVMVMGTLALELAPTTTSHRHPSNNYSSLSAMVRVAIRLNQNNVLLTTITIIDKN
jgi:hypothetical protein